jgi:3-deoxy-D-manno-octulosonic-acid transferase
VLWLYDALSLVYLTTAAPAYLYRMAVRQKDSKDFFERFGFIDEEKLKTLEGKKICWIHAVSVGEVHCAADLIRKFKKASPESALVVSTVTDTGRARAKALDAADVVLYLPLDVAPIVRKVLSRIRPDVFVVVETELWPRLLMELRKKGCKTLMVNGRISDRSFTNYQKTSWFWKKILPAFHRLAMQSEEDAERILAIGAGKEQVQVTGNMKFDMTPARPAPEEKTELLHWLGLSEHKTLLVAGSTHPGEEEIVLRVFTRLHKNFPDLELLLAPRHVHRADEIEKLIHQAGFHCRRRSRKKTREQDGQKICLLDTMGELGKIYSLCHIAFIGKSLLGWGGQNPIEPALWSKPVLFGPHMENFRQASRVLLDAGGAVSISNEKDLETTVSEWLNHPEKAALTGRKAAESVRKMQGATGKNLELILSFL